MLLVLLEKRFGVWVDSLNENKFYLLAKSILILILKKFENVSVKLTVRHHQHYLNARKVFGKEY